MPQTKGRQSAYVVLCTWARFLSTAEKDHGHYENTLYKNIYIYKTFFY